jgi:hypothetical protein
MVNMGNSNYSNYDDMSGIPEVDNNKYYQNRMSDDYFPDSDLSRKMKI